MGSLLDFGGRVVSGFRRSQGFLLAGAVAYYTLLAIVPLFVVLLVGLSHVVDEHRLLDTVASNLQLVIPSQAAGVTEQVASFLAHREVVGIAGLLALVFFSSTAFTVIESAMAIIFCHRARTQHRHFLVSVLLPYLFMMLIGVGLLLITVVSSALHAVRAVRVFGYTWPPAGLPGAVLYLLGVVGLALLLTAFYMVLPVGQIRFLKVSNTALRFRPPSVNGSATEGLPGSGAEQGRSPTEKRPSATGSTASVVWVLGRDGRPVPVQVTLGITDGTSTEIVGGDLSVGQAVLVGVESGQPAATPPRTGPGLRL